MSDHQATELQKVGSRLGNLDDLPAQLLAAPAEPERCQADAPICPWCDRQGLNICQHADDAKTCLEAR